jgi:hypothetical protein
MDASTETTAGNRRRPAKQVSPKRRFYFQVPNIVFDLGLSPYELALYCAIRRTTDESEPCFRSGSNLARLCRMSAGKVSTAKQKLALPFPMLGMKPLIQISSQPSPHGGKPCHHISLVDIWPENTRFFRPAPSPGEEPDEVATSPDDLATSSDETKKTPLRKIKEEEETPSNPSSREEERESPQEEIFYLWRFVCKIFKREDNRAPSPQQMLLIRRLLPVPPNEYELIDWWFGLNPRDYHFTTGIGFQLRRKPRSVTGLLRAWGDMNDLARPFRKEFLLKNYMIDGC